MCMVNKNFQPPKDPSQCELEAFMKDSGLFHPIDYKHDYSCECGTDLMIEHTYTICPNCQSKYLIHPKRSHEKACILKVRSR